MASRHFTEMIVELERLGFEFIDVNTSGGETWQHSSGMIVGPIYSGLKEHQHRNMLRDINRRLGVKAHTNKRKVGQIKERQAKAREIDRAESEARMAWLKARIHELELADSLRRLDATKRQLLRERIAELEQLKRLMTQVPTSGGSL